MAGTLSLSSRVAVFPCPNCRETINTAASTCPFCGTLIDLAIAEASAAETSRISQACSDGSYLKIMAWSQLAFAGLIFVPFLGLAGIAGTWFLRVAIPIMFIRWWVKFGRIKTADPEFRGARNDTFVAVGAVALSFLLLHFWVR